MLVLDRTQVIRHGTFAEVGADTARSNRVSTTEPLFRQGPHHRLHDHGDACHHINILDLESRRTTRRILDKSCPFWDTCHSEPGFHDLRRCFPSLDQLNHLRVKFKFGVKSCGNAVGCNIVMGWPDASRRKDIVILRTAFIDRADDNVFYIRDDTGVHHPHPQLIQRIRQVSEVSILGSP